MGFQGKKASDSMGFQPKKKGIPKLEAGILFRFCLGFQNICRIPKKYIGFYRDFNDTG